MSQALFDENIETDLVSGEGDAGDAPTGSLKNRANALDGKTWTRNSVSIWSDLRKSAEEVALKHPAMFPLELANRVIETFTMEGNRVVLDPFVGVGTTVVAAKRLGKTGIGIELSREFAEIAERRVEQRNLLDNIDELGTGRIIPGNAFDLPRYVSAESVDLCLTSPPYWDILNRARTADYKSIRHYGNFTNDLGTIEDYGDFLKSLSGIFGLVLKTLKPGGYCCVVVMDIRKKDRFYPFHSDIADFMRDLGYLYDDLIIWDRRHEYNNLRPLGYPAVFRVNKVHEFILIFQKPKTSNKTKT